MAQPSLSKIIELINKTGDTCIVVNAAGEPAYVMLPFDRYERIVTGTADVAGMTENELLEKINRDIALWKGSQETEEQPQWTPESKTPVLEEKEEEKSLNTAKIKDIDEDGGDHYYFEPID